MVNELQTGTRSTLDGSDLWVALAATLLETALPPLTIPECCDQNICAAGPHRHDQHQASTTVNSRLPSVHPLNGRSDLIDDYH